MLTVYKCCFAAIYNSEIFHTIPVCLAGVITTATIRSNYKSSYGIIRCLTFLHQWFRSSVNRKACSFISIGLAGYVLSGSFIIDRESKITIIRTAFRHIRF